jgi:beta-glucosidase-like glycosyl hydrolase
VPVADFTIVIWWDDPGGGPTRMASFFPHEQALAAVRGGTG